MQKQLQNKKIMIIMQINNEIIMQIMQKWVTDQ